MSASIPLTYEFLTSGIPPEEVKVRISSATEADILVLWQYFILYYLQKHGFRGATKWIEPLPDTATLERIREVLLSDEDTVKLSTIFHMKPEIATMMVSQRFDADDAIDYAKNNPKEAVIIASRLYQSDALVRLCLYAYSPSEYHSPAWEDLRGIQLEERYALVMRFLARVRNNPGPLPDTVIQVAWTVIKSNPHENWTQFYETKIMNDLCKMGYNEEVVKWYGLRGHVTPSVIQSLICLDREPSIRRLIAKHAGSILKESLRVGNVKFLAITLEHIPIDERVVQMVIEAQSFEAILILAEHGTYLIESSIRIVRRVGHDDCLPFLMAVLILIPKADPKFIRELIYHGCNPNGRRLRNGNMTFRIHDDGSQYRISTENPLECAVRADNIEVARLLLECGAFIHIIPESNLNPNLRQLYMASTPAMKNFLIEAGMTSPSAVSFADQDVSIHRMLHGRRQGFTEFLRLFEAFVESQGTTT